MGSPNESSCIHERSGKQGEALPSEPVKRGVQVWKWKGKKMKWIMKQLRFLFVDPLRLVNRQQHTAHTQLHIFPRQFLTSVDQMIISSFKSAEARNRPSGENDSDHTQSECFLGRIRFCFVSSVSTVHGHCHPRSLFNGFHTTIDPLCNPLINEN